MLRLAVCFGVNNSGFCKISISALNGTKYPIFHWITIKLSFTGHSSRFSKKIFKSSARFLQNLKTYWRWSWGFHRLMKMICKILRDFRKSQPSLIPRTPWRRPKFKPKQFYSEKNSSLSQLKLKGSKNLIWRDKKFRKFKACWETYWKKTWKLIEISEKVLNITEKKGEMASII